MKSCYKNIKPGDTLIDDYSGNTFLATSIVFIPGDGSYPYSSQAYCDVIYLDSYNHSLKSFLWLSSIKKIIKAKK